MKVTKSLKYNDIVNVPFEKNSEEFCLMKRQSYQKRLAEFFSCSQLQEIAGAGDNIALKIEKT